MQLYVFDMLAGDGEDLRKLPLRIRKTNLSRLLARRVDGIHLAPFEQGDRPGPVPPRLPDRLEGMVSKHRESIHRGGRFRHWIKIKNRGTSRLQPQDQF